MQAAARLQSRSLVSYWWLLTSLHVKQSSLSSLCPCGTASQQPATYEVIVNWPLLSIIFTSLKSAVYHTLAAPRNTNHCINVWSILMKPMLLRLSAYSDMQKKATMVCSAKDAFLPSFLLCFNPFSVQRRGSCFYWYNVYRRPYLAKSTRF